MSVFFQHVFPIGTYLPTLFPLVGVNLANLHEHITDATDVEYEQYDGYASLHIHQSRVVTTVLGNKIRQRERDMGERYRGG